LRDYVGIVHTEKEADLKSDYDLSLARIPVEGGEGEETAFEIVGIDATKAGNEGASFSPFPSFTFPSLLN
jgi:hypothetical protein